MAEADRDALTGVAHRRVFEQAAAALEEPAAMLMLDIDKFLLYNHDFGHNEAGDNVVRSLASILTRHTRPADLVARYGGNEFVLLLPQTTLNEAELIAEQVRADVAGFAWPHRPITVSFGVAPLGLEGWQGMIVASEKAVREAKSAGGNCIRVAQ